MCPNKLVIQCTIKLLTRFISNKLTNTNHSQVLNYIKTIYLPKLWYLSCSISKWSHFHEKLLYTVQENYRLKLPHQQEVHALSIDFISLFPYPWLHKQLVPMESITRPTRFHPFSHSSAFSYLMKLANKVRSHHPAQGYCLVHIQALRVIIQLLGSWLMNGMTSSSVNVYFPKQQFLERFVILPQVFDQF